MLAKHKTALVGLLGTGIMACGSSYAEQGGMFSLENATLDVRYRAEFVDQDGLDENALATTIRTRAGYNLNLQNMFSAYADVESIRVVGSEDYNSTSNGNGQFPVVADPEDFELNQAYLAWAGVKGTVMKYGRQRINLDNQRFVGAVGWRQNEQTFDGFTINANVNENVKVFAAHLTNANRIFGDSHPNPALADLDLTAEMVNVSWKVGNITFTPYVYLVEFDRNAAASNATTGLRVQGKTTLSSSEDGDVGLNYVIEYAQQGDYKDGNASIDHDYLHTTLGVSFNKINLKAGYEVLGSNDGQSAFSTPLATLHKFNGWADLFLGTPADGLRDTYLSVGGRLAGFKMAAVYHTFSADVGGSDFGTEVNFVASRKLGKNYSVLFKYADYSANEFGTDRSRGWLQLGAKF